MARRDILGAIRAFDLAESHGYDANECSSRRWQCWMLLGSFEEAWRECDRISGRGAPGPHDLWDGRPFEGERVVIRCLHGYGDAIQFVRYAELVGLTASRIIVETHPEMVSLLRCVPFIDEVVTWASPGSLPREAWDRQIEVTELPRAFRTTVETIPAAIPYIHSKRDSRAAPSQGKLRVGLVWASSMWNPARCVPLLELLPVLRCAGCEFFSFQRGTPRDELVNVPVGFRVHDTSSYSPEIVDTAADLTTIDLLISVDTMAAHLAGALGRRVWTLLPFEADWRWMLDREDTPWYPTMRLFRQTTQGEWGPVVAQVARDLRLMAG